MPMLLMAMIGDGIICLPMERSRYHHLGFVVMGFASAVLESK